MGIEYQISIKGTIKCDQCGIKKDFVYGRIEDTPYATLNLSYAQPNLDGWHISSIVHRPLPKTLCPRCGRRSYGN